jgi:uncharacterized protein (DUF58 family)
MVKQSTAGWVLVALSLVLLLVSGRLELLAVLLPLSILMGYGILRFSRGRGRRAREKHLITVR